MKQPKYCTKCGSKLLETGSYCYDAYTGEKVEVNDKLECSKGCQTWFLNLFGVWNSENR